MSQDKTDNLKYALNYLNNGWSIFPTRGKKPLIAWEKYQKVKPNEQQVIDWWNKWPDADIAGATGVVSGIVVIDVDGGEVPQLPPTAVSETSPGHYQYFFNHPGFQVPNSTKLVAPNVDIRGDGGFVVLPPSRHFNKETGEQDFTYKWSIAPKEAGFANLPEHILEKVKTKKSLDTVVIGSSQGSRNNDATVVAGSLLSKHPRGEWESICWPLLQGWNEKNNPPLSEDELKSVFDSIASREITKNPRQNTSQYRVGSDLSRVKPEVASVLYHPLPLSDLSQYENPVEWIWEGYLAKGHQTLLSALWKAGKTTLITNFLKCLQDEQELAGQSTHKSNVLIISEESDSIWARRREENGITLPVWILSRPIRQKLGYKEWIALLEQMARFCKEYVIDLFIIDTLSGFWPVDNENDAARVSEALLPLNYLLEQNIAILLVHHFRKSGGDEGTASRGSGQLGAAVDIMVEFSRLNSADPNGTQRVLRSYSRFEETPKEVVIDYVNGGYETKGTRAEVTKLEKLELVLNALEDYPEGVTASELYEKWNISEYNDRPSKRTLQRHLSDLVVLNKVTTIGTTRIKGGEASIYIKLSEQNPRQQPTTVNNPIPEIQPQNLRQDTAIDHLSQVSEQREEGIHDQRPKLGIPTYD